MKKMLAVIFLVAILTQGCATVGGKETASPVTQEKCEIYCEPSKTMEACEKESREFFGLDCRAVRKAEWMKERFPMKKQWTIRK